MKNIHLFGCKGCGSAIVEAALVLSRIPYDYTEANYEDEKGLEELQKVNSLGQVPVLILPDKSILTESAAIINYINFQSADSGLAAGNTIRDQAPLVYRNIPIRFSF